MRISSTERGTPERVFVSVTLSQNEWTNDVDNGQVMNQRGMVMYVVENPINLEPLNPGAKGFLGNACGVGSPQPGEYVHMQSIGVLETDLWHYGTAGSASIPRELYNIRVLCQVYGHSDRIITSGPSSQFPVGASDRWLATTSAGPSGSARPMTQKALLAGRVGLSGIVIIKVNGATVPYDFTIDFRGNPTTNAAGVTTQWEVISGVPLTARKPAVRRDVNRSVSGSDDTADLSGERLDGTYNAVAYHYQEDEYSHSSASNTSTPYHTISPESITRGFVVGMGIAPKGV